MNKRIIKLDEVTPEMRETFVKSGDYEFATANLYAKEVALSIETPIRRGILEGNVTEGIFTPMDFTTGVVPEFPLDFVAPGTESDYIAYVLPNVGRLPEKNVEGDYITVPAFPIGATLDYSLKFARDARWDILKRAKEVMNAMFTAKINKDAFRLLVAAGYDRNVVVTDSAAPAGFFTKRLMSLMQTQMNRSGGGNFSSVEQFELTDIWLSPESMEDIRSWDFTQIDDQTRREIWLAGSGGALSKIYNTFLHPLKELGDGQVLQTYYTSLGASFTGSDTELVLGLCLNSVGASAFVNPVVEQVKIFADEQLHRMRRQGWYGWMEHGLAILDNRAIILGTA